MAWRCPASLYSPWAAKGKVMLGSSLTSSAESRAGGNQAPALWDASPPAIAALPRLCRCLPVPTRSRGNQPSVGFKATDFPFPPRFACHLLKRSGGLSGDDTISLGTVPPPAPGCLDTPEYRWSLAASHPQLNQPGLNPHRQHPPGASSFSSPPSPPSAGQAHPHAHPITNRAAGLLPAGVPPPGNSVFPEPAGGGHKRVRGWGRGATGVTQRGEPAGGRGIPAAAAQRSPYLLLMSLSGGDPGARGFYSAR